MEDVNKQRAHALDGLRGLAASVVVFYHAILHNDVSLVDRVLYQPIQHAESWRDFITKIALVCLNGGVAVYVFFVMSGCVLRLSLQKREDEHAFSLCSRFAVARLIRLYPPVIFCLFFFYVLSRLNVAGFPIVSFKAALENAVLWKTWPHGPSTTVQAEVLAVPFIAVAWLLRKRLGFGVLCLVLIYSILAIEVSPMVFNLPNMNGYLFAFIAGMLVAEPAIKPLIKNAPSPTWWAAVVGLLLTRAFFPNSSVTSLIAEGLASAVLVAGLLYGERGSLARILEGAFAQSLGRVSFSLYLLNVPVLYMIWAFTDRWLWPKAHALELGILVAILAIALTWPIAWLSERWVEQPSMNLSRKVWTWFRSREASALDAAR